MSSWQNIIQYVSQLHFVYTVCVYMHWGACIWLFVSHTWSQIFPLFFILNVKSNLVKSYLSVTAIAYITLWGVTGLYVYIIFFDHMKGSILLNVSELNLWRVRGETNHLGTSCLSSVTSADTELNGIIWQPLLLFVIWLLKSSCSMHVWNLIKPPGGSLDGDIFICGL